MRSCNSFQPPRLFNDAKVPQRRDIMVNLVMTYEVMTAPCQKSALEDRCYACHMSFAIAAIGQKWSGHRKSFSAIGLIRSDRISIGCFK